MRKRERGLPDDFRLAVSEATVKRTPVVLDDYLEREIGGESQPLPEASRVAPPAPEPVTRLRPVMEVSATAPGLVHVHAPEATFPSGQPSTMSSHRFKTRQAPIKGPRVQLNMTPQVQRMVQDVVGQFCSFGVQKDTSASEVFEALLTALHEAREHLDLSNVPPRGQWGTPTARAFRTNLKNAVIVAIARHWQRATS